MIGLASVLVLPFRAILLVGIQCICFSVLAIEIQEYLWEVVVPTISFFTLFAPFAIVFAVFVSSTGSATCFLDIRGFQ